MLRSRVEFVLSRSPTTRGFDQPTSSLVERKVYVFRRDVRLPFRGTIPH
ncbi:hypothetical protein [Streptomyces sp. NPDC050538]